MAPAPGRRRTTERAASPPTLADVAAMAGVSTATVSRCLNTPDQVSKVTRDRVLQAVQRLGYSPNAGARALAGRRNDIVGAIVPTLENAIFARGLQAFQEELERQGFTLLVASSSYRQDLEEAQIRKLVSRGADGLLLIGHDRASTAADFLARRGVPHVIAWAVNHQHRSSCTVGFDNRAAMQRLTEVILEKGHRQIGVISAQRASNDRARQRVEGVTAAAKAQGLPASAVRILETDYSFESGGNAFEALMALAPRPTVVICGNDVLAVGALERARALGLDVPRDVSITGFDDIEIAAVTSPRLTTVHVPHREMGRRAAEILTRMIGGEQGAETIELPTRPVLRETLGDLHVAATGS